MKKQDRNAALDESRITDLEHRVGELTSELAGQRRRADAGTLLDELDQRARRRARSRADRRDGRTLGDRLVAAPVHGDATDSRARRTQGSMTLRCRCGCRSTATTDPWAGSASAAPSSTARIERSSRRRPAAPAGARAATAVVGTLARLPHARTQPAARRAAPATRPATRQPLPRRHGCARCRRRLLRRRPDRRPHHVDRGRCAGQRRRGRDADEPRSSHAARGRTGRTRTGRAPRATQHCAALWTSGAAARRKGSGAPVRDRGRRPHRADGPTGSPCSSPVRASPRP